MIPLQWRQNKCQYTRRQAIIIEDAEKSSEALSVCKSRHLDCRFVAGKGKSTHHACATRKLPLKFAQVLIHKYLYMIFLVLGL